LGFSGQKLGLSILPRTKLGKAITYAINQWQYLEGHLTGARVEIDTR